jgi:hypothetical protein
MSVTPQDPTRIVAIKRRRSDRLVRLRSRACCTTALTGRSQLVVDRSRAEDNDVWLTACLLLPRKAAGSGTVVPLLGEAIALAAELVRAAVEAWPLASGVRRPAEAHVGRRSVFRSAWLPLRGATQSGTRHHATRVTARPTAVRRSLVGNHKHDVALADLPLTVERTCETGSRSREGARAIWGSSDSSRRRSLGLVPLECSTAVLGLARYLRRRR